MDHQENDAAGPAEENDAAGTAETSRYQNVEKVHLWFADHQLVVLLRDDVV